MAKKSKRPPAHKQQQRRPQPRPAAARPQGTAMPAAEPRDAEFDTAQDDYASGSLPVPDSDGPMPLPPVAENGAQAAEPAVVTGTSAGATTGTERRRVGRVDPSAAAVGQRPGQKYRGGRSQSTAAMFEPLPPDDAAIPFDRVPYVPGDLRRVLIIAGLMVVLIVVANFVINAIVK